jgi:hypothetical protein
MGSLHGRSYVVELAATAQGTRYNIRTQDGTLIAADLSPEAAASYFGGQDPRDLVTHEASPPIMSAEDHRSEP